jgi:hypothetical protein
VVSISTLCSAARTWTLPAKYHKVVIPTFLALKRFYSVLLQWPDIAQHVRHLWIGSSTLDSGLFFGKQLLKRSEEQLFGQSAQFYTTYIMRTLAQLQSLGVLQRVSIIPRDVASSRIIDVTCNANSLPSVDNEAIEQSIERLYHHSSAGEQFEGIVEALPHLELFEEYYLQPADPTQPNISQVQRYAVTRTGAPFPPGLEGAAQEALANGELRRGRIDVWGSRHESILFQDWEARIRCPRLWK